MAASPSPSDSKAGRSSLAVPLLLLVLALLDLRVEIQILLDHFTLTSLLTALLSHPLAIAVLVCVPSLMRRYGRQNSGR